MLIKEVLKLAANELNDFPLKQMEARILLAHALKLSQESLLIKYNEEILYDDELKFFKYLERRKAYEPIAYIIGKKEFHGLDFQVNKEVLIPRADTEILVETVIEEYKISKAGKLVRILDLGTGSGAIAVSLAVSIKTAQVIATDLAPTALEIASKNAQLNKVSNRIEFIESDWYSNLVNEKFDFIVSNPPYVSSKDKNYITEETLLYEPEHALFAGDNGLSHYKTIISDASSFLKNDGKIFLEMSFNQATQVAKILKKHGFNDIKIMRDLQDHERVAAGSLSL